METPLPLPQKGTEPPNPPIFGPCLLWPNEWMDEAGTWHGGRHQTRRLCVRWGPSTPPLPKRGQSPPPQYSAHFYCGQTAGCIKMSPSMEIGLSPEDSVIDGEPAPSPKRGRSPQFSAHVYCGQTAAWIKILLSTEVGLEPDDIVLDGHPAPPSPKGGGTPSPIFGPFLGDRL